MPTPQLSLVANGKLYAPCGIFGDAFSSPATDFAKADNQKRWKPARILYYSMLATVHYFYLFVNKLNNGSLM
jgi:hypothetical protein